METIIAVIIALIIAAVIIVSVGIWFLSGGFLPSPAEPEITYGEFPFKLEYEINGKTKVVEDTLICEYDGFAINAARGKYRHWKSYLASGNERITLIKNGDTEIFFTPNINNSKAGAFYMGDNEICGRINKVFPNAWQMQPAYYDNRILTHYVIFAEDMWEKYKIKLISWEIKPPIQNYFK